MIAGKRHPITLRFLDPETEAAYEREHGPQRLRALRQSFPFSLSIWFFLVVLTYALQPPNAHDAVVFVLAVQVPILVLGLVLTLWAQQRWRREAIAVVANATAGISLIVTLLIVELFSLASGALLITAGFVAIGFEFLSTVLAALPYLVVYDVVLLARGGDTYEIILAFAQTTVGIMLFAAGAYYSENARREAFLERQKSERLLRNILPDSIADRLRDHDTTIADAHDGASVLFADLVGFTPLSATMTPAQTIQLLDELFTAFDELAARHGLEKIKTIGDAYMVAGGVPEPRDDHADAVAAMGLDMLAAVVRISDTRGVALGLRVGIHTGPVVAGVIGKRKFSYDLWGDTVNTASRMESHGVAGRVQISDATRTALGERFVTEDRGEIDVKGKGAMRAWLLGSAR